MSQPTPPPYDGQQPYQQQPYQQPAYQQPAYPQQYAQQGYGQPQQASTNTMAIISLIAGIVGIVAIPIIGSIVAVITGPMAKKQIAETGEQGEGMAKAGIITGWIGLGLWILFIVGWIAVFVIALGSANATMG